MVICARVERSRGQAFPLGAAPTPLFDPGPARPKTSPKAPNVTYPAALVSIAGLKLASGKGPKTSGCEAMVRAAINRKRVIWVAKT